MLESLDAIERRRWLASPLWGDRWTADHAALPVVAATATPATAVGNGVPREALSLDGAWKLAGALPGREFSIDRWVGDDADAVRRQPVSWHLPETDRSSWVAASVPGTVQGSLVEAGVIPDPLQDANTYDELIAHGEPAAWPWHFRRTRVEQQEWWYAREFRVPEHWRGKRVRLRFDGIDYSGTVYLNGEPIAQHAGMYGGPEIDITALVRFDGDNELVVRIDPPPRDWHGVMKPSPGWGWHYGHLISIGLWRSVVVEAVPDVELADVFVATTRLDDDGAAHVRVQWDLVTRADVTGPPIDVAVEIRRPDGSVAVRTGATVAAASGTSRHALDLHLPEADLWWPFGYGEQPLHRLEVAVAGDVQTLEFGVRTVDYLPLAARRVVEGEEEYDWQLVVNGRPMFVKGANWCWTDSMARRGFEIDRHLLDLVRRANLQMVRAWGGGTVESDAFFDECDRLGILVLQEFPLSFGIDASAPALAVIDEQASRIVRRLRNHPSLVLWGGGNENPATRTSDDALTVIGRRVAQLDPTRRFHRTDPWGGSEHFYGVYHEGMPVDAYRDYLPAVFGEYGLSSQCDVESMQRFLDPALLEQWPPPAHGAIVQHQSQFSLFDLFKQARYAHYGPLTDWSTFIEYSQIAQGDALRFASERMRAEAGEQTAGYWFYKIGEAFPGASWSIIDYYGRPKLSYYRAAQFGAARSAFAVTDRTEFDAGDTFSARVVVSNDTPDSLARARVTARLYDAKFRILAEQTADVTRDAGTRADAFTLETTVPAEHLAPLVLSVALDGADGIRIASTWYAFNARADAPAARALEAMRLEDLSDRPADELLAPYFEGTAPLRDQPRTTLAARRNGDAFVIENISAHPAPLVIIDGFPHEPGRWLADNAFGLEPGERRVVPFHVGDGDVTGVRVRAWNADSVAVDG
ncbi:glycoside hydrolase family 2 protein [Microbacterium sp. MC2]